MTKKNLTAALMALLLSVSLTGAALPSSSTQTQAKSVTQKAAQSVTSISPVDSNPRAAQTASRSQVRVVKVAAWKTRGVQSSAWQGKGYSPRWENVRKCIVHRESRGVYTAKNRHSSAMGAYQFLDRSWRKPLAKKIHKTELRSVPIRKWSRVDQDRAFWQVWNNGKGRSHWKGGSYRCW